MITILLIITFLVAPAPALHDQYINNVRLARQIEQSYVDYKARTSLQLRIMQAKAAQSWPA